MLTFELADAITTCMMELFRAGNMFKRAALVMIIKKRYPRLVYPRLDLDIGQALNRLIHTGELQRIAGSFYAPGKRYCR